MTINSVQASPPTSINIFSDVSEYGRLYISGPDALDLLNRLTTNDLSNFTNTSSVPTVLTNGDAKVIDYLLLAGDGNEGIWCITSKNRSTIVAQWLDLYTFGEDIVIEDRTENTAQLIIVNSIDNGFLSLENAGFTVPAGQKSSTANPFNSHVMSASFGQYVSLYVLIPNISDLAQVKSILNSIQLKEIESDQFENLRIYEGVPSYSKEFGEFNNPLEARFTGAISETKGCYTGQEVIARLQTYRKIQRLLMSFDANKSIETGTVLITEDGQTAGTVTSAYQSEGTTRGLALVSSKYATQNQSLTDHAQRATIKLSTPHHALATEPSESELP